MVKATPISAFVVMQTQFGLQRLIVPFDSLASLYCGYQHLYWRACRQARKPVMAGLGFTWGLLDHKPLLLVRLRVMRSTYPNRSKFRAQRCRASFTPGHSTELTLLHQRTGYFLNADRLVSGVTNRACTRPASFWTRWQHSPRLVSEHPPHLDCCSHRHHIQQPAFRQRITPGGIATVCRSTSRSKQCLWTAPTSRCIQTTRTR